MNAHELTARLGGQWSNGRGMARCPAHEDDSPSLSIADGRKGRPVFKCHAGCEQSAVIAVLKQRGWWNASSKASAPPKAPTRITPADEADEDHDRFIRARGIVYAASRGCKSPKARAAVRKHLLRRGIHKVPANCYATIFNGAPAMVAPVWGPWIDGKSCLLGCHVTYLDQKGVKMGRRRFGPGAGGHIPFADSEKTSKTLLIAEGIEDALSVRQLTGLPAWCALSAPNMSSIVVPSRYREVIVCADSDEIGRKKAKELAQQLARRGRTVRIAYPPDKCKDWNDAICQEAASPAKLAKLILNAEEIEPPTGLRVVTATELMNMTLPPRENLLAPWLPVQGLAMLHAPRGIGKTYVALGVAHAIIHGSRFLRWECVNAAEVLYLDGELPQSLLQARLRDFQRYFGDKPRFDLRLLTPDLQDEGLPDLGTPEGQQAVDELVTERTRLIVVDSISTLVHSVEENSADGWTVVQNWALKHRSQGRSVLFIHHSGKTGAQRGTSRREDVLDSVIGLKRPKDYTPEMGMTVELHYEKSRGFFGSDAAPVVARLRHRADGRMRWTTTALAESQRDQIEKMLEEGMKQAQIAKHLNLTPARISQISKEIREQALES